MKNYVSTPVLALIGREIETTTSLFSASRQASIKKAEPASQRLLQYAKSVHGKVHGKMLVGVLHLGTPHILHGLLLFLFW